ncbi:Uu.00g120490.m01.CDS01 [Anthostomella pinea]|uniref:Uu.00g120490.m01.CDS01 n=1 Tax=Anthostomella pinea TaxID=933095 RepID=A0AAI8VGU1_9PEZI|nr:Uu.00g120490.m01.CDS01 [Anthostomella pinea]
MHAAQVQSWSEGPRYTAVDSPPAPSDDQIQLRVLAAGAHRVVRSRAAGKHYSARALPHRVGIDCVGQDEATGKLYYYFNLHLGTFAEYINVDRNVVYELPDGTDPASFAASVNPAFSSWMAITQRTFNLPKDYTVLIVGATSASGLLAAQVARDLGAGKVIGVARNAAALDRVAGLDEQIVLKDPVTDTDFSQVDCDVILDYVYGDVTTHILSSPKVKKPVQYVQIGSLAQQTATLPSHIFRSYDLTMRGAGPGAWSLKALAQEMKTMVPKMAGWKLLEAHSVPLKDIETAWNDTSLAAKGRVVFVP